MLKSAPQFVHLNSSNLIVKKDCQFNSTTTCSNGNTSTGSPIFHCRTLPSVPIFFFVRKKILIISTRSAITAKQILKIDFYLLPEDFYVQSLRNYRLLRLKTMKRDKIFK